jgi:DNA-binding NarL/FixJ family response regulator
MQTTPVFIVERHPIMRAALCNAIASESGLSVAAQAAHGGEIFHRLETFTPGIVLFAVGNPGLEDMKMLSKLRGHHPNTPILALTTSEVPGQEQAALDLGANAVVAKTVSRHELIAALRQIQI